MARILGRAVSNAKVRRALLSTLGVAVITFVLLALLEGLVSIAQTVREIAMNAGPARRSLRQAIPDTLLGWINKPGFREDGMFGEGGSVMINSRSMREVEEVPDSEPGKLRLICSGDSFTFGLGVANDETWCAQIERFHPDVRTLNVGTSGYGVDQAYLRYRHDVEHFAHDVHVFAFIPDDIRRVRLARFNGYPKPHFHLDQGRLELRNVPVPRLSWLGEIMIHHQERLNDLRIVGFAKRLVARMAGGRQDGFVSTDEEARAISIVLLDSLAASAARQNRLAVFVLLEQRVGGNLEFDELATWLAAEATHRDLTFWDLRKEVRTLPVDTVEALFSRTWGHYSVRGNAWVAERLWRKLLELPGFEQRLRSLTGDAAQPRVDYGPQVRR
jgi:hypothetical protein